MEKTLYNQVGEIKGKEAEDIDSFSFQFTPQNDNLKRTRGSLFSLVTVKGEEKEKLAKATAFYQSFQSSYYAKSSGSIIKSLSDTLDATDENFNKKDSEKGSEYSLIAAVLWGSVLYLAKLGEGSVFIFRSGKIKQLEFTKVASGVLENQDTVCLASNNFAEKVTSEELSEFLATENFEKSLEAIDKKVGNVPGATCVVIRLTVDEPEMPTEPLEIGQIDEEGKVEFPEKAVSEEAGSEETKVQEDPLEKIKVTSARNNLSQKFTKLLSAAQSFANGIVAGIKKPWAKREPGEHVDHVVVRRQRIFQIVGVIVAVLLVSILVGSLGKNLNKNTEKVTALIASANSKLNEAKNEKTIDPNRAQKLVSKAQEDTQAAKKLDPKNSQIAELESKEASLIAEITRTYRITNLKTVFDFTTLSPNAKISRIALAETTLLATDQTNNSIYSVDIDQKKGEKISSSFDAPNNIASATSGFYVQTAKGVEKVDKISGKTSNQVQDQTWGEIAGAASYQGNLYLLDRGKGQIWKYLSLSAGLAAPKAYLLDQGLDLKKASGIAIDGFVWVANENGVTFKLSQGKKQEFSVTNMAGTFNKVVDIYTDVDADNLYFLDKGKGSLTIVSKKDGVYMSQYSAEKLKVATGIVVNESKKTVYFAAEGKLYSFTFQ